MNRVKVDSSAIREIGHDETGCEVQYHRTGCARQSKAVTDPDTGEKRQAQCNCEGGEIYFHAGVPKDLHDYLLLAPSIGAAFQKHVKGARHPETGALLYPHVKRNGPGYTGI
jgi:hypothetical protein